MKYTALFVLITLMLCAIPVQAQTVQYTAAADEAIWGIDITAPVGSTGLIILYMEDGSQVSGQWSYMGYLPTVMHAEIGSASSDYNYNIPLPVPIEMSVWNGDNSSSEREIKMSYGQTRIALTKVISTSTSRSPTVGYRVTSGSNVVVNDEIVSREEANAKLDYDSDRSPIALLLKEATTAYTIFDWVMWILGFVIQNIRLIVVGYFLASMAYFLNKSRNIFDAFGRFLKAQEKLVRFIVEMAGVAFNIAGNLVAIMAASSVKMVATGLGMLNALLGLVKR